MSDTDARPRIALIGYGEVGQILAADLQAAGIRDVSAWDREFPNAASAPSRTAAALGHARVAANMADALVGRSLIISAVTAGNCAAAALEAARTLPPRAIFLDLNSVAPGTKSAAAAAIEAGGGRFVEAAVMSPIAPQRIATSMLIGGPHAAGFEPLARALGFSGVRFFGPVVGRASAAKMCRSVIIKGLESLLTESLLAARHYGVEATVLASLRDLFPHEDWERIAAYMITRSLQHGRRRAEEMREAARTVAEAGLEPSMSLACASRQDWSVAHRPTSHPAGLTALLDALMASSKIERRGTA
jgi:3-hydroxyisobutyrate dehydrogenase-like beta-hydroxyacid dehydrogenase